MSSIYLALRSTRLSLLFILCLSALVASCQVESSESDADRVAADIPVTKGGLVDCEQFSKLVAATPNAQIVDVRTPQEYEGGNVAGSVNMDYRANDFETRISTLDKSKPVFVYCHSGGRSAKAASELRDQGFEEVYDMDGGYSRWSVVMEN